ncbi:MAG TPA: ROK family transcriptional regulator [Microlunatus sp.]
MSQPAGSSVTAAPARRHNLSRLLTLVHREGAQSRAALTRRTGLNRSTIGGLVTELVQLGLVLETGPTSPAGVGRPSPLVTPAETVVALTVNPDIDAVTVGLVGLGGTVHKRIRYPVSAAPTATEAVNLVAALVDGMRSELDARFRVLGVGVAVPGLVERSTGTVTLAPHLGWRDEPLADRLRAATGYRCVVSNDARAALVAELWFGAGRDRTDVVYLNGSASGIGGGVVSGGEPLLGRHGYAGELGHSVVNPSGHLCHCGRTGCLETEVTRAGLLDVLGLDDVTAESLGGALRTAVAAGSPSAIAEVERQLGWLAQALGNTVNVLDPEVVVLGGFLADLAAATGTALQDRVRRTGFAALSAELEIVPAELGADVLTVGAAELVFANLLADPQSHPTLAS